MAFQSPADYATDVVLRDGSTLHLRPVRSDDDRRLLEMFGRMSAESLYYRFMSVPKLDLRRMAPFTNVDFDTQVVLVAESAGALAGVAGYYRTGEERAEVAFAVRDDMQGRGLGTRLLERLAEIARERGLTAFDAHVMGENRRMLDVFLESGFEVSQALDRNTFHVVLQLAPTARFAEHAAERSQKAAAASMRPFFDPKVIAVVGANREPGRIGSEIFRNLRETGFTGVLAPVHPDATEIQGVRAYSTLASIPARVDLAVIVVPAARVPAVIDECIACGVKAVVVISAGFGETGADGQQLEASLVDKIRAAGIRMIGPNCMGIINTDPAVRLNATFSPVYPPAGRVAFSTQSGALGLAILDYVRSVNLGISTFASIGNKADVSGNDLIQYWAEDPRTDVILLYLESFGNPVKFAQIARRLGRRKPIVAVKAGRSDAGARAASSHTGARATSDVLVDTMLRQSGVIRTHTLEELFDVATLLASQPVPAGRRVVILTNAGGPGILAADACEANGLELPALSPETVRGLRMFLPAAASTGNPVDMIASATAEQYGRAMALLLADPVVDSLLVIFIPPLVTAARDVAEAIRGAAAGSSKPVAATFMGQHGALPLAPVPTYMFPESAAVALARVTRYGEWQREPVSEAGPVARFDVERARGLVASALDAGGGWMPPADALELLQACGVRVADGRIAATPEAAAAAARDIGFPVAVKALGATIVHKTEVGGVRLGLTTAQAVSAAFTELALALGDRLEGVLVQRMIPGGVELVAGALNDQSFGPVVMAGTGGVFVELLGDTVFRMCPLADEDAAAMVDEMKGRTLLRGYRGAPPADEAAFRDLLVRVSRLAAACPEIAEMDLNPVMVLREGAIAADVRVRIAPRPQPARGRRISY